MKKFLKIAALLMALTMIACVFASCGDSNDATGTSNTANAADSDSGNSGNSVSGATEEHGYYKVFVPAGYVLKHEDAFGDNNPKSFNINLEDSSYTYFMFNMFTEDNAKTSIESTKNMNEGANTVTVEYGGKTWTGVAYDSLGISCFSLYADFDGNFVIVSAAGNAYDGDITSAVLSSLEVNVTE